MFDIPDERLRLLNIDAGKKYSRMEIDVKRRSDLTPISILFGIVVILGIPQFSITHCST
jgi:hypothetical protein